MVGKMKRGIGLFIVYTVMFMAIIALATVIYSNAKNSAMNTVNSLGSVSDRAYENVLTK